jgi:opacity protein-like surface antigen
MKKSLLVFFLSFMAFNSDCQDFKAYMFAGVNASQVDGDQNGGYNKFGPRLGFGIQYPMSEKVELGFELMYSHKGSQSKSDKDDPGKIIVKYRYNYIELPLLMKYRLGNDIQLSSGLSAAYLINAKADEGGGFAEMTNIKKSDFLLNAGAIYAISETLHVEGRFQYSMATILEDNVKSTLFRRRGAYHNLFGLSLIKFL